MHAELLSILQAQLARGRVGDVEVSRAIAMHLPTAVLAQHREAVSVVIVEDSAAVARARHDETVAALTALLGTSTGAADDTRGRGGAIVEWHAHGVFAAVHGSRWRFGVFVEGSSER